MHILCANLGENNAVVISQENLAKLCGISPRSVSRAIKDLVEGRWIEVRQIGVTSQTNAYVVNARVAWHGKRDGLQYSLFSATVVVSAEQQPDREDLGKQAPLRRLPRIGEQQLPTGDGLDPPSQAYLDGFEPDLPATNQTDPSNEARPVGRVLIKSLDSIEIVDEETGEILALPTSQEA